MSSAAIKVPVRLPGEVERAIRTHAREAYPEECCGILFGRDSSGARKIVEARPAENAFAEGERHHRFTIAPHAMLVAEKYAAANGHAVVGFYHSHPDHPAKPSEYDRSHAWGFYSYLIVSVEKGVPRELRSWRLDEQGNDFAAEEIVVVR